MPQHSRKPLRPNPFKTYRDPVTGLWHVVLPKRANADIPKVPAPVPEQS